jgi:hypothetical protein
MSKDEEQTPELQYDKNRPPSEWEFDIELPSEKMVEYFNKWDNIYTVDKLTSYQRM